MTAVCACMHHEGQPPRSPPLTLLQQGLCWWAGVLPGVSHGARVRATPSAPGRRLPRAVLLGPWPGRCIVSHLHLSDPQPTVSTSTHGRWPVAGGIGQVSPGSPTGLPATCCPQWVGVAGLGGGHCCPEPCRRRSERQRDSERRATPTPGLPGGNSYLVCLWIPRVAQPYEDPQATSCSPGSVCSPVKWTLVQYN